MRIETKCVSAQMPAAMEFASLSAPIHRASTIVFPSCEAFERRYENFYDGFTYGPYGTPTSRALEHRISEVAGASRTLLLPSGQSALSLICLALLRSGDHVLITDAVYDPVRSFATQLLCNFGITATFYDPLAAGDIARVIDPSTRLILTESPGSGTMEVQDLPAIAAAARARGIPVIADNTWATPLNLRPLEHGAALSVEALSKYIGGHSDVVLGAISTNDEELYRRLKDMTRMLGLGVSADDCGLVLRGLETLAIRLQQSAASALAIATWLTKRPEVDRVIHPALPGSPGHELWRRDFSGASGVFSIVLKPAVRGEIRAFVDALKLFAIGASWGGTRSVVSLQDPSTRRAVRPWTDGPLIRLSIGLEHKDDLIGDLEQAFRHMRNAEGESPVVMATKKVEDTP